MRAAKFDPHRHNSPAAPPAQEEPAGAEAAPAGPAADPTGAPAPPRPRPGQPAPAGQPQRPVPQAGRPEPARQSAPRYAADAWQDDAGAAPAGLRYRSTAPAPPGPPRPGQEPAVAEPRVTQRPDADPAYWPPPGPPQPPALPGRPAARPEPQYRSTAAPAPGPRYAPAAGVAPPPAREPLGPRYAPNAGVAPPPAQEPPAPRLPAAGAAPPAPLAPAAASERGVPYRPQAPVPYAVPQAGPPSAGPEPRVPYRSQAAAPYAAPPAAPPAGPPGPQYRSTAPLPPAPRYVDPAPPPPQPAPSLPPAAHRAEPVPPYTPPAAQPPVPRYPATMAEPARPGALARLPVQPGPRAAASPAPPAGAIEIGRLQFQDLPAVLDLVNADLLPGQPRCDRTALDMALRGESPVDAQWWQELSGVEALVARRDGQVAGAASYAIASRDGSGWLLWLHAREERAVIEALTDRVLGELSGCTHLYAFWIATALTLGLEALPVGQRPVTHEVVQTRGLAGRDSWRYLVAPLGRAALLAAGPDVASVNPCPSHREIPAWRLTVGGAGQPVASAEIALGRDGCAALWWIEVDPAHRRRGIGRQLLGQAMRFLASSGARTVCTFVDHDDPRERDRRPVLRLLSSAGFQEIDGLWSYESSRRRPR